MNIDKPKIYIETTVISYYTSLMSRDLIIAGHQQVTQEWWETQLALFTPYISEIVYDEISRGDPGAAKKRIKAVEGFDFLSITPDVIKLAHNYYDELDLPEKARLDSIHLALAVEHGMAYLISWNFTHIVGARPRSIIEQINYQRGIKTPVFCTPEELMEV